MTAESRWTADELATIDGIGEVDVATRREDGTLRTSRIVWIVSHDDAAYVRSVNGATAAWYRGVQARHEGELAAGVLRRDVVFVEAGEHAGDGSGLGKALGAAYPGKDRRSSSAGAPLTAAVAPAANPRHAPPPAP